MMNGFSFTERVRKVLNLARNEATRLHHEYVGTEHILLGLVREGEGCGVTALQSLKVDLEQLRSRVEGVVTPGRASSAARRDLPYTSRAKHVLELAMMEARTLNHSYLGTEHLLLGLIAEGRGIAAQALTSEGVTLEQVRSEVLSILGTAMPPGVGTALPAQAMSRIADRGEPSTTPPRGTVKGVEVVLDYEDGGRFKASFTSVQDARAFLFRAGAPPRE